MTFRAYQFEQAINKDSKSFDKAKAAIESTLKGIHKNYDVGVDKGVFENVMPFYNDNVDANDVILGNLESTV